MRRPILDKATVDDNWLNRDWVAAHVTGVEYRQLGYVPGAGLYYLGDEPFTGVCVTRSPDGQLRGVTHFKHGLEHGLAVGWYGGGQVKVYNEMAEGVCHGWHREWSADEALQKEGLCVLGQPQRRNRS